MPTSGSTQHRDAQVRQIVTRILRAARAAGCASVTIENLDFAAAVSRDNPSIPRGRRGRLLRGTVARIPTGRFRDRLVQMAANTGMWVVAVDPAYTSKLGRSGAGNCYPSLQHRLLTGPSQPFMTVLRS